MQNSVASSVPLAQAAPVRAMGGMVDRKKRWALSCRGRVVVASALLRVGAVEGWVHEYTIRAAVDEFRSGSYKRVFTTGGPVVGTGGIHQRLLYFSQRRR